MAQRIETRIISIASDINERDINDSQLHDAVQLIQSGEVVVFPTETVYGLGANALDSNASSKIFKVKNRPSDNPLIVHVSDMDMLNRLVSHIPEKAHKLIEHFWPGPLTILFPKSNIVPDMITAGHPTVGIRMPSHIIAKKLIHLSQTPIAAPSANISGRPSPTTAQHVLDDLNGRVHCIIDNGPSNFGLESTVIDVNQCIPLILRPGGISIEKIRHVLPDVQYYGAVSRDMELEDKPPTPGLKYQHYCPNAKLILYEGDTQWMGMEIQSDMRRLLEIGKKVGILQTQSYHFNINPELLSQIHFLCLGNEQKLDQVAHGLFWGLRKLDSHNVDVILMQGVSEENEGMAIMNRARKAASSIIKKPTEQPIILSQK